ncbi:MAG: hypothetical protein ACLQQ4_01805 [Bacteroidia bacterium]
MKSKIEYRLKITELAEKLESGYSTPQILKEYMPKWGMPRRTLERYIAFAQDIITSRMKKREAVVEAVRADIIAKEAEQWMKSNLELEARLCAIVSGKLEFEKKVKNPKGVYENVKCRPSCSEMINAIDLLLKMRGVYKAADGKTGEKTHVIQILADNPEEERVIHKILDQGKSKEKK